MIHLTVAESGVDAPDDILIGLMPDQRNGGIACMTVQKQNIGTVGVASRMVFPVIERGIILPSIHAVAFNVENMNQT